MLSTIGPDGWATIREKPERIRAVTKEVESLGLRVIAQYALMGQYDFVNIIDAPDEATMARAAVMLASRGTMRSTTMQALTVDDFNLNRLVYIEPGTPIPKDELQRTYDWMVSWDLIDQGLATEDLVNTKVAALADD